MTPLTDTSAKAVEAMARDIEYSQHPAIVNLDAPRAAAMLRALRSQVEALEKDAARYRKWRWLALIWKPEGDPFADAMMKARVPADIDAAIDAAMASEGRG